MRKKAVMGEGIIMIYRMVLITFIAFVVLGVSSIFYSYYIDVRDAESWLLARQVSDCLNPNGELVLSEIGEDNYDKILDYCKITPNERFYVGLKVYDGEKEVGSFYQGDRGAFWQVSLYDKNKGMTAEIGKYKPGYFEFEYPVSLVIDNEKKEGLIKMEVLVTHEF
jgi:hypothetical protein